MKACTRMVIGVVVMALGLPAALAQDDSAARARLRSERTELQAQFERRERDCTARDAPRHCVDAARREQRAALAPLRREEAALDAARRSKVAIERAAARPVQKIAADERARREQRSREAYESRQRAAQERRDAAAQRQANAASAARGRPPAAPLPVPEGAIAR